MKKLIIGAAFAVLLASPAFAQAYDPNIGSGNIVSSPGDFASAPAFGAYAYAPAHGQRLRGIHAQAMAPDAVEQDGHNVGQDPDANVRLQLRRDAPWTYE
jgi:opacity protein-like surface antigen